MLINDEGQHPLWPAFLDVPSGWTAVCGEVSRQVWGDPKSLKSATRVGKESDHEATA